MFFFFVVFFVFFQAEDGIRDLVRSRGLGDVYKRQRADRSDVKGRHGHRPDEVGRQVRLRRQPPADRNICLLYTSDAADDLLCVDLGGRRIIKKKRK